VDEIEERYVKPFYLHMMRLNALSDGSEHLAEVRSAGRSLDPEIVVGLLRSHWRPRVMGAWYALFHDPAVIGTELLRSLETSSGDLTAPPLAAVSVAQMQRDALSALEKYITVDLAHGYGAAGFAVAAIEHLGGSSSQTESTDESRTYFARMLAVAETLRDE
jgi:hypothetical protein